MLLFLRPLTTWLRVPPFKLFGPLLWYDLVRSSRRKQYIALRGVYALLLLTAFFFLYGVLAYSAGRNPWDVIPDARLSRELLANFALYFFLTFLGMQMAAVWLLTPIYTAGVIVEEKECQTLDYLLSTDLSNHEIVLSFALSRLANLSLVLLVGLPVLSLLQFLGGIDPPLVLAGFAVTGLSMLSLTSLSILLSIYARRARYAVLTTYAFALAYLLLSGLSWLLLTPLFGWATGPTGVPSWLTLESLIQAFNAGNPITAVVQLCNEVNKGIPLETELPGAVAGYAIAHGLVSFLCLAWAVYVFRVVVLRSAPGPVRKPLPLTTWRWRPPVWKHPLLWKELCADPGLRLRSAGRIALGVLVPITFMPALAIGYVFYSSREWNTAGEAINIWARATGMLVMCLMWLGVALRAAASIGAERDRQTLDSLLTTPLSARHIVLVKWLGSMGGGRRLWLWLALVWLVGTATGNLAPSAIFSLILVWLVGAMFLASLGLLFSVAIRRAQRALQATLLAVLLLGAGHWFLWVLFLPLTGSLAASSSALVSWMQFQAVGLTPPAALVLLGFSPPEHGFWFPDDLTWMLRPLLLGLACWLAGAVILGTMAVTWFQLAIGRHGELGRVASLVNVLRLRPHERSLSPPSACQRVRIARALAFTTLLMVLIALGVSTRWFIHQVTGTPSAFEQAIAEADRLDPGWRLEELEANRRDIADKDNGALQIFAIRAQGPTAGRTGWTFGQWPDFATSEALKDLEPPVQLDSRQQRLLRAALRPFDAAIPVARRMKDFPHGRHAITYSPDGIRTMLPHVSLDREVADLLAYDSLWRIQVGDIQGTLDDCRAMIYSGNALGDEPMMVTQLCRTACWSMALNKCQRALAQGTASEEEIVAFQQVLQELEREPFFVIAFRAERAMMDRFLSFCENAGMKYRLQQLRIDEMQGSTTSRNDWISAALFVLGLDIKNERAVMLRFMNELVEVAKLPAQQQQQAWDRVHARANQLPPVARLFVPSQQLIKWSLRVTAQLRAAIALLALERYRLAHQRWPNRLADLVPLYLTQVPIDPYDGQPLRYRRLKDGVVVYTLGSDLQDNGGQVLPQHPRQLNSPGTDIGYRLWDPAARRQPPRATPPDPPPHP